VLVLLLDQIAGKKYATQVGGVTARPFGLNGRFGS
jgi:hypothetical protein